MVYIIYYNGYLPEVSTFDGPRECIRLTSRVAGAASGRYSGSPRSTARQCVSGARAGGVCSFCSLVLVFFSTLRVQILIQPGLMCAVIGSNLKTVRNSRLSDSRTSTWCRKYKRMYKKCPYLYIYIFINTHIYILVYIYCIFRCIYSCVFGEYAIRL